MKYTYTLYKRINIGQISFFIHTAIILPMLHFLLLNPIAFFRIIYITSLSFLPQN